MFRSKLTKHQHSEAPANEDGDPITLSVRQQFGLELLSTLMQKSPTPPPIQSCGVIPSRQSTSQPIAMQPFGSVEPPFIHPSTSQSENEVTLSDGGEALSDGETDDDVDEAKLLKVVRIVNEEGAVLRTEEMCTKEVHEKLKFGERISVPINENSQPVGAGGKICTKFIKFLIEQPNLCLLDAKNWHEVKQIAGVRLLLQLRDKFSLPFTEDMDRVLLYIFGSKFRNHKHKFKKMLLKKAKEKLIEAEDAARGVHGEVVFTEDDLLQALDLIEPPSGLTDHQWSKLKANFMSDEAKNMSKKGKVARATQIHSRTTGSTSYAQKKHEFKIIHKREPHEVEFFDITHVKKNGSYVQEDSREFMNVAKVKISQKMADLEPCACDDHAKRNAIEKEVMQELMGPDKPGRARGHGIGVTKSQVTDFSNDLRRMRTGGSSDVNALVRKICSQDKVIATMVDTLKNQDKVIATLADTITDLRNEIRKINTLQQQPMYDPYNYNVGGGVVQTKQKRKRKILKR